VKRDNGQATYFAGDIAYHYNKIKRGFNNIIDIFGADHHGYMPRIRAIIKSFDFNNDDFAILLVQFAILYRQGERVQMSTRSGSFVTLRELRDEVGNDAARFFYIMRKADQHLDFDLDLAKSQSQDNPLYYIQYAYARICNVFKQLTAKGETFDAASGLKQLHLLVEPHEQAVLRKLSQYAEILEMAAMDHEPHKLAHYLRELATDLHSYYNAHVFLVDDPALRNARLALTKATAQILSNGLQLLGVSAPEQM
jgi:arginyl-tRNA synthetase